MMNENMIGCCGLNCEVCDAYQATIHNDQALREKTAALWSKLNETEIRAEQINCRGCQGDGVKSAYCEQMCAIRPCAEKKGFATCAECPEMNACETLGAFLAYNPEARKTLEREKSKR